MEPFSITAGCLGIISTIAHTSASITHFVRDVRDSRRELSETKQQLAEIEITLNLINDDHNRENGNLAKQMPEGIVHQTKLVLDSCRDILVELDGLIVKYNSERRRAAFQWARKGKDEVGALNKQLEAHARTLHMSLEFSTLIWSRVGAQNTVVLRQESQKIIENTEQVLDDTGEIKLATTRILENQVVLKDILAEVEEVKASISQQEVGVRSGRQEVMRRYLDSLTDYGESEMGGESPTNNASMSGDLTPRLENIVLDPIVDSFDLQEDGLDHCHQRTAIPESANLCEVQSTGRETFSSRAFGPGSSVRGIQNVYIAVMGTTGSGKTSFISLCTGQPITAIKNNANYRENDVHFFNFMWNSHICVHMIEFAGLEKAYTTNHEVLGSFGRIASALNNLYARNMVLSGIVYLHRISGPGLGPTDRRSLGVLRALCGSQSFQAITLVTAGLLISEASWRSHEKRLAVLGPSAEMLAKGSRTVRCNFTRTSVMAVVDSIVKCQKTFVLELQSQLVDEGLHFEETRLGLLVAESARNPTTSKIGNAKEENGRRQFSRKADRYVDSIINGYESGNMI